MTRRTTLAAERLYDDRRFADRFRRDPEGTLRRYRLDHRAIGALKAGDVASLAAAGVDVAALARGDRHGLRNRTRSVLAGAIAAAGLLGALAPSARAARRMSIRATFSERKGIRVGIRANALQSPLLSAKVKLQPFALGGQNPPPPE